MVDPTDLNATLTWLAGAGLATWAILVSDFFRNHQLPKFEQLAVGLQQAIIYAVMAIPPILAYVVLQVVPPETIEALAPHYKFVAALFTAMLAARGIFEVTKFRPAHEEDLPPLG